MLEPQFPYLNQATLPCGETYIAHTANSADTWSIVGSDDSAPKLSDPSYTNEIWRWTAKVYKRVRYCHR